MRLTRSLGTSQAKSKMVTAMQWLIQAFTGLTFRPDGFGDDRNTLYFTAGINNGQDGLFGTITTRLGEHNQGFRSPFARQHSCPDYRHSFGRAGQLRHTDRARRRR